MIINKKFKSVLILCLCSLSSLAQTTKNSTPQLGKNSIKELIAAMTLEEKIWLLMGSEAELKKPKADIAASNGIIGFTEKKVPGAAGTTFAIPRLGIPAIVLADGPAGVRISATRKDDSATYYATAFPVGTLLASTWDVDLVNKVGTAFGNEVLEYGVDVILAPGNNIQRNPLNGRNFEYYSEDPLVSGKIAAAIINGLQSNGIGTSLKHLAANNHETRRFSTNAEVSERALREIYLKAFQVALKESEPWTVMTSYNKLNGTYTAERYDLVTEILRKEWNYKGLVVTDWGAAKNVVDQIKAGHSLIMPGQYFQVEGLQYALANNKLDVAVVDQRIEKFLELVLKTPTFKNYKFSNKPDLKNHAQVSRLAATEGMVLLKNTNNTLPISKNIRTIATFGNTTYNLITGGTGSGMVNKAYIISLGQGLTTAGYTLDPKVEQLYTKYVDSVEVSRPTPKNPAAGRPQIPELQISDDFILKQSVQSDMAMISVGKNAGEGADRNLDNNYHLMDSEISLIKRVYEAFKAQGKKTVVVLNIGGVIDLASWENYCDAILLAWQPGQEGGNAIADILTGKVNPSGKLAITFPEKYTDVSSAKNFPGASGVDPLNVVYEEGIYTGYRYYDTYKVKPAYEFGYGLSYTTFSLNNLKLNAKKFNKKVKASVTIKNTGNVAGKEVVQIYIAAPSKSIDKPVQELRAFAKTKLLKPGESQVLKFTITADDLSSYIPEQAAWIAEAGTYTIKAGVSSQDIRMTSTFYLVNQIITEKVTNQVQPSKPIITEYIGK
ncbi:MAG: beta-glucosidase [Paludibacter sp.]|nr:beta-glucosidase [Paludibacter sp.]